MTDSSRSDTLERSALPTDYLKEAHELMLDRHRRDQLFHKFSYRLVVESF